MIRTFLGFVLGFLIGILAGAYFSFNFLIDFGLDKIPSIAQQYINDYFSKMKNVSSDIIKKQEDQIITKITEEKEQIKKEIKQQVMDYINEKIDNILDF